MVLDANILLSAFVGGGTPDHVLRLWPEKYELYLSEYIIAEVERTFGDSYFQRRIPADQQATDLRLLRSARLVRLELSVSGVATQPKDDPILATALNGRADYLVT